MLAEYEAAANGGISEYVHEDQPESFLPQIQGGFGISGVREGRERPAAQMYNEDYDSEDGGERIEQLYQSQLRAAQAASLAEAA